MAFLPHAQRWRALAVVVACLLLSSGSGALQIASGHGEPGRQICMDWTRKDGKNAEPTDTRSNLGIPDRDQNRMEEARKEYEESLKIYRKLVQKDPEAYLPSVAATLNNLGILDRDKTRMKEALKTYRELAQKDPTTYLPDVAAMLDILGNLDSAQNRMNEGRKKYEETLKIYRELAQKNPET